MSAYEIVADGETYGIRIDGAMFYLLNDANGYYVGAVGQRVAVQGSPVVVTFDPPVAPTVDAGAIYQAVVSKLP